MSHEHDHAHSHCPNHASCAGGAEDPRAEAVALMRYMVAHNAAHADELAKLADRLRNLGDAPAAEQVMLAVSDYEKGNLRLSTILASMNAAQ